MVSTGSEVGQRKGPESAEHASVPHHSLKVAPSTHRGGVGWAQETWVQVSMLGASVSQCRMGVAHRGPGPGPLATPASPILSLLVVVSALGHKPRTPMAGSILEAALSLSEPQCVCRGGCPWERPGRIQSLPGGGDPQTWRTSLWP